MRKKQNSKILTLALFTVALVAAGFFISLTHDRASKAQVFGNNSLLVSTWQKKIHSAPAKALESMPNKNSEVKLPILMYHHVGPLPQQGDRFRHDLTANSQDFETEVKWVKEQGFQSITLNDFYNYTQGKFQLPKKPIIFTFDDGYDDVFTYAIPILKKYGFTGSFALITQWQGTTVGTNTYATWDVILAAKNDGLEMVCHTQNHFDGTNPKFDANYIFQNLSGCKKDLADHGIQTNILIYPYGHYTPEYIELAKKAGFQVGVTVKEGSRVRLDDLMHVPRVRIHGQQSFEKFKKLMTE